MSKFCKKYNTYDLSGEYGIGYTYSGCKFMFDLEDYDLIKNYCWRVHSRGYICTDINVDGIIHTVMMHRLIMGCDDSLLDIDHKRENSKYDNRKSNLRIATRSQNMMNTGLRSNNTSGVQGVSFDKSRNRWMAKISVNHKQKSLGRFDNFEDAVRARKEAEEKYYGEFSYDNSRREV